MHYEPDSEAYPATELHQTLTPAESQGDVHNKWLCFWYVLWVSTVP